MSDDVPELPYRYETSAGVNLGSDSVTSHDADGAAPAVPYRRNDDKRGDSNTGRVALTDAERDAVEWCVLQQSTPQRYAVTLRGLLKRMK